MSEALTQDILNLVVPTAPRLSPDGSRVVYGMRRKWNHRIGKTSTAWLWIADTALGKSARPLTDKSSFSRDPIWSPDGRYIAFASYCDEVKHCAIYIVQPGVDEKPKPLTPLSDRTIMSYKFAPSSNKIAFLAGPDQSAKCNTEKKDESGGVKAWGEEWEYAHLWIVDVETKVAEAIFDDPLHVVDFSWNDDGDKIAFVTHRSPDRESKFLHGAQISILDVETRDVENIALVPGGVWSLTDLTWVGSNLYFLSYNDLRGDTTGLVTYSIEVGSQDDGNLPKTYRKVAHDCGGTPEALLKVREHVVFYNLNGPDEELRLLGGENRVLYTQRKRIVEFDAIWDLKNNDFAFTILSGDVNHPTEVFYVNRQRKIQLSDHGAQGGFAGNGTFGHFHYLQCSTLDGKEVVDGVCLIPSQYAGPDGKPTKPLPTLVSLHGGPYSRFTDAFDYWHPIHIINAVFLMNGIAILMPNYRGSSGRGQRYASYAAGGMGVSDEPDIVAMTQHAIEQGFSDPLRLVVGGWSQGGYLSYLSAVRNGKHGFGWRFQGAIAGAGVTDWGALTLESDAGFVQTQLAGFAPWRKGSAQVSRMGSALWEFGDAAEEGRIPPMLMLHGEKDARVPVSQAIGFRRALEEVGLPFELVIYPGEGHHLKERSHVEDSMRRMLRFVLNHVGLG